MAQRAVSPAMREHLRRIASMGGKSTAAKYGGWRAPHEARKARGRKVPRNVPSTSVRRQATPKAPAKVSDVTHVSTIQAARVLGLPPSAFGGKGKGTIQLRASGKRLTTKSLRTSTSRTKIKTRR